CRSTSASGAAPSSVNAPRSAPSTSIPPARFNATSSRRQWAGSRTSSCRGVANELSLYRVPAALVSAADVDLVVAQASVVARLHPARAEQHLHRLVHLLLPSDGACARARRRGVPRLPGLGREPGNPRPQRRHLRLRPLPRRHLVQAGAAGDGRPHGRQARAGRADRRRQLRGLGGRDGGRPLDPGCVMARRPIEPFLWIMFSAGGVLAALFVPVLLFLFGFAYPLGWLAPPDHAHLVAVIGNPLVRILLFLLCALCLAHAAHRFRYTLYDGLQLQHLQELVVLFCYGSAVVGSIVAAVLLWRFG